ncbi:MAG: polyprenyl synthetase family protein [Puniceicoccaceae bacterium]
MQTNGLKKSSLPGNAQFMEVVKPLLPAFGVLEEFLASQVSAFEPEVQPLVEYCFGHSGKKLRPILVFSLALDDGQELTEPLIKAAAIVELVHLATLVHDDILDGADVRHRTETVVSKYGAHVAVLLGDALFAHALHLAAQYPDVEVCRTVSLATRQVCSGEIAQTFSRGQGVPSLEAYYRMIDLKTAELFNVSAYLGAYLTGLPAESCQAARDYARHLGIAYQIYDDAADIFAAESTAGKTLGTDLGTGKYTLPVLLWLKELPEADKENILEELEKGPDCSIDVRQALEDANILEKAGQEFYNQIDQSIASIKSIPGESRQQQLRILADFVKLAWNKFNIR